MTPDEQGRMTPENFCYWLQGFSELSSEQPTPEQWTSICEHLQLVLKKVTGPVVTVSPDTLKDPDPLNRLGTSLKKSAADPSYTVPSLTDMARRANDCTHPIVRYWEEQLQSGIIPISDAYRRPRKEGPAFDLTGQITGQVTGHTLC